MDSRVCWADTFLPKLFPLRWLNGYLWGRNSSCFMVVLCLRPDRNEWSFDPFLNTFGTTEFFFRGDGLWFIRVLELYQNKVMDDWLFCTPADVPSSEPARLRDEDNWEPISVLLLTGSRSEETDNRRKYWYSIYNDLRTTRTFKILSSISLTSIKRNTISASLHLVS